METKQWEFEEEETSDGQVFSVYDEHGDRLTMPYISQDKALLIAVAPEIRLMLERAANCIEAFTQMLPQYDPNQYPGTLLKDIRAAIAKAQPATTKEGADQ